MKSIQTLSLAVSLAILASCGGEEEPQPFRYPKQPTAVCGDGRLDAGEECDRGSLARSDCSSLGLGEGELHCTAACRYDVSDCSQLPVCGDGVAQWSEACDGDDVRGQSCADLERGGGALRCTSTCNLDLTGCELPPVCGDGVVDPGEACDGASLANNSCSSLGYDGGVLHCTAGCGFDTSLCFRVEPTDQDEDGIADDVDNCPLAYNPLQVDSDSDGVGNVCDNCPSTANPSQIDSNHDGIGDTCQVVTPTVFDEIEPNDASGQAQLYTLSLVQPRIAVNAYADVQATGTYDYNDVDFYRVRVLDAGEVSVQAASTVGDLDMWVTSPTVGEVAAATESYTEELKVRVNAGDELLVKVAVWTGSSGPYKLSLALGPVSSSCQGGGDFFGGAVSPGSDKSVDYPSMAIDSAGHVFIVYRQATDKVLKLVSNKPGYWVSQLIDGTSGSGAYASLAVAPNGSLHVAYSSAYELTYANNTAGSWMRQTVDREGVEAVDLAIDADGFSHIVYLATSDDTVRYATNRTGLWTTTIIDDMSPSYSYDYIDYRFSIAVDAAGFVHVTYYDLDGGDLRYATNRYGSWSTQAVDTAGTVGATSSLAVDAAGKAYVAYYDYSHDDLLYATNASGVWTQQTVASSGTVGVYSALALDADGKAHIVYVDETSKTLEYATNSFLGGFATLTAGTGVAAESVDLAVTPDGKRHIVFVGNGDASGIYYGVANGCTN